jgi:hypothetical protein
MGSGAEISPSGFNAIRQYTDCPLPCHRPDMMPSLRNPTYKAIRVLILIVAEQLRVPQCQPVMFMWLPHDPRMNNFSQIKFLIIQPIVRTITGSIKWYKYLF